MKRILVVLFLSVFTMTAWAVQYPQRTITDSDGHQLAITPAGDITIASESRVTFSSASKVSIAPGTSITTGQTAASVDSVTTYPQVLGGSTGSTAVVKEIQLIARMSNTGNVWIGGSSVATTDGIHVSSTSYLRLPVHNLSDLYVVSDQDASVVEWIAIFE